MHPTLRLLATGTTVLLSATVQAQSYTATLLNRPSGADTCFETQAKAVLGANGDVATNCNLLSAAIFGAPTGSERATVWRAGSGTAKALAGTLFLTKTTQRGLQSDGTVLGYAYGSGSSATLSAWRGTTRGNFSLPSGYTGWELDRVSPDGQTLLIFKRNDGSAYGRGFALVKAGVVRPVAAPPAACGSLNRTDEFPAWAINNVGQMALTRTQHLYGSNGAVDRPGTLCLWDGAQWQVSARTPDYQHATDFGADNHDMALRGLSDQGEVLADRHAKFTWQPNSGFKQVDDRAWTFTATGDLAGGASPTATTLDTTAVWWRNGQAVNLNQAATAPAGYQLSTVLGVNAQGQVLVLAQSKAAPALANARLVLLNPR